MPALQALGALHQVSEVLSYHLDCIGDETSGKHHEDAATETLKLALNLTMHLGPLGKPPNPLPKPEEVLTSRSTFSCCIIFSLRKTLMMKWTQVSAWQKLVPHIHRVMELGAGHQKLQHFAVAVLVNTPQGCAHLFRIDHASVDSLIDFMQRQFYDAEYATFLTLFTNMPSCLPS